MTNSSNSSEEVVWHIWTFRSDMVEHVKLFLENNVKEVSDVICPTRTIKRYDRRTKNKRRSKKRREVALPIYGGYIFLQYTPNTNNADVWEKLNSHPFILNYIGPCSAADVCTIRR